VVFTRPIAGKRLLGTAGSHTVVTDRKTADGGTDTGPTSSELLLLAMASCATGSIRNSLVQRKLAADDIRVDVEWTPPKTAGARDGVLITVSLPPPVLAEGSEPILAAATRGAVVSRIRLGSDVEVRLRPLEALSSSSSA
jgi:putative redox protein